ncbi:uncharacterized protein EDB91DRAFT_1256740 [Suillus paluster]|uniref:uncharacterized protein n=1 Tax=Suillus paluster TaxID=48578 RepID=UPI001B87E971|nr:uncharacterized protein EDB91DRAFT_1256740 [Suillus paluster]KAG1720984.1 hypothetical protein EDB91DRAFT_1256740 [Suillus paluster]
MPSPTKAIALNITNRDEVMATVLLAHHVVVYVEDNMTMLMVEDDTKVKVPDKCVDLIKVVVHQLQLYQRTTSALMKIPQSSIEDWQIQFYLALTAYTAEVITAFAREVKDDAVKATNSKWRSAYLDYHIALLLQNSAFTKEHQTIAVKKMKRSWIHFQEKKVYKPIESLTHQGLHQILCVDGDDSCGGPFEHKRSIDEMIEDVITKINASNTINKDAEKPFEVRITQRPQVKATAKPAVVGGDTSSVQRGKKSNLFDKRGRRKENAKVAGTGKLRSELQSEDEESNSERLANDFERQEDAKKSPKPRKTIHKSPSSKASGKGKAEAQILVADSGDEASDASSGMMKLEPFTGNEDFWSMGGPESDDDHSDDLLSSSTDQAREEIWAREERPIRSRMRPFKSGGHDDTPLPPTLADWDDWHKIAFEQGTSEVFLKLATWMLLRFRQLSKIDIDADVNGVIIPSDPRTMRFPDGDEFLEALGMERLYSAIVHMEARPAYLSHIFHALGAVADDTDIGSTHPAMSPTCSPPAVRRSMMFDQRFPWLSVAGEDDEVSDALQAMDIDDDDAHVDVGRKGGVAMSVKRKRTSSHTSPLKTESGRRPSKRPKDDIPDQVHDAHADSVALNASDDVDRTSTEAATANPSLPQESVSSGGAIPSQQLQDETSEDHEASVDAVVSEPVAMMTMQDITPSETTIDNSDAWLTNMTRARA